MATLVKHDLAFILQQILIAEAHPDGSGTYVSLSTSPTEIPTLLLPWGLRTVTGIHNNLVTGQSQFGAADTLFPRLAPAEYKNEGDDSISFDINGPAPGGIVSLTNNNYNTGGGGTALFIGSDVVDADPRIVSNLIADQSIGNQAAVAAWQQKNATTAMPDAVQIDTIDNTAPDVGLSAPFNSWFTFFGQFFDHGLDLVTKGGNGTVYIPLQPDDPLITHGPDGIAGNGDEVPASRAFMAVTRATQFNGAARDTENTTTSWVDQNQTYTSHPSHQAFLREYTLVDNDSPVSTGKLLDGAIGSMATWGELKTHIAQNLGFRLTDYDVGNAPLLATDAYGNLLLNNNGRAQLLLPNGGLLEGNPAANGGTGVAIPVTALRTGHAFLNDISHPAGPFFDHDRNPNTGALPATPDANTTAGDPLASVATGQYDNELLEAHYITGDGRGNENIGLTTVHHIFHSEHNRQIGMIKQSVIDEFNLNGVGPVVAGYLNDGADTANGIQDEDFNGARLFQAARYATEMQYQHLVFEEFARKINPFINLFSGYATSVDPSIVGEFAHTVYRFGHSMLTNTIDRINPDGTSSPISLIDAFLDPAEFALTGTAAGATGTGIAGAAAGSIVRGLTQQVGNEIDEFVVDALRTNLLGLPLDLPAINMARGRDVGIPSLNSARRTFFEATSHDAALKPYDNWEEFGRNLRHAESLVNFVAAYGTHASITAATTLVAKRTAATLLVNGDTDINGDGILDLAPVDRLAFMNGTGAWANVNGVTTTGLDTVDFWMGGLAENPAPFGGMLGSTFGFVFEITLTQLQDGDRFYYLSRNVGLNFLHELENNSFAALIMKNTTGIGHLPADSFSTPTFIFETANVGSFGPIQDDPATPVDETAELIRTPDGMIIYTGDQHVVMGGTPGDDRMSGSEGDDSVWGDAGNDRLEGGAGNDFVMGGDGNDIMTDSYGDDVLKGGAGHDVINSGLGLDLVLAGAGSDFAMTGPNTTEVFGGGGNDFILGGSSAQTVFGNEGDDWIEGGDGADLLQGDNGDPFQVSSVTGNDVVIGGGGTDDYDTESGDDIMVAGQGVERNEGMLGFDWVTYKGDTSNGPGIGHEGDLALLGLLPPQVEDIRDRFDLVEGVSGGDFNDTLRGNNANNAIDGVIGNALTNMQLISGAQALLNGMLGGNQTLFDSGNIILGGDGNDLFEGRGGDDLIDGNKYLTVRLGWIDQNNVQRFSDSMTDPALQAALFSGQINPSQLSIVREILTANGAGDINTAMYNQPAASYTITRNNARGTTSVTDNDVVTAGLDATGLPLGPIDEGTDTLRNIQRLMFMRDTNADGIQDVGGDGTPLWDTVTVAPFNNNAATGALNINDTTPQQGQTLSALRNLVADAQTINQASVKISWQVAAPGTTANGAWTTVSTSPTFVPGNAQVGQILRAVMDFEDGVGNVEQRISAATAAISNINDAPSGTNASVSATEDTARTFSAADFGFTDPDGGTLNAVRIDAMSLPAGSSLTAGGNAVTAGQIITAANLGTLSFSPVPNATGDNHASFTFSVRDAQNAFDATPNTLRVNVTPANDAPNGTTNTISIQEEAAYVFTAADFGFTDVDAGDAMRSVQINNPPAGLLYNNLPLANGAVILIDNLFPGRLVYTAALNVTGPAVASFTFAVRDLSNLADPTPATFTIGVTPTNDAAAGQPTISDTTPTRGAAISASVATIIDTDGVVAGSFTYQCQSAPSGSTSWTPIAGATVATFTPGATQVGQQLRVVVNFTDGLGNPETVTSQPTVVVGDFYAGNNLANVRTLTNGSDVATGNGGNDVLVGMDSDDTINGDGGNDLLDGGNGNDVLSGGANDDNLLGGDGADNLSGGSGIDILVGGTGFDVMDGGLGNDIFDVDSTGDVIVEAAGGGTDTIQTSLTTFSLAALPNVENLAYGGTDIAPFIGTGNAAINNISGGEGNDRLDGLGDIDVMSGGLGNDTYVVNNQGEVVELANEGTDTVESTVTYTLANLPNIENVTLLGAANINATGNAVANVLVGNTGNNTLNGGANIDTMSGGAGDDIYVVDVAGDITTELDGQGTDLIQTALNTFSLASRAFIENLTYTGNGNFTGVGNDLGNTIVGGNGTDDLNGGLGVDNLNAGAGSDTYRVDDSADVVAEQVTNGNGGGTDTVISTANSYTLSNTNIDNLTFAGTGNFVGTGNGANNVIIGGAGVDTLTGLGGNDTLTADGDADFFLYTANNFGTDTITDFDSNAAGGQDLIDLSGLGITAANLAARVTEAQNGTTLQLTVLDGGGNTSGIINLSNVDIGNIDVSDYVLA